MIRTLSIAASASFVLAVILLVADADSFAIPAVVLLVISVPLGLLLAIRRAYVEVREIVGFAHNFVSGDVQHARVAEISEPRGIFTPASTVTLELEGEDGVVRRFDREVPVPFPLAISHRLGRRLRFPVVGRTDLSRMLAFELRREGLDLDLDWRPPADAPIVEAPASAESPAPPAR